MVITRLCLLLTSDQFIGFWSTSILGIALYQFRKQLQSRLFPLHQELTKLVSVLERVEGPAEFYEHYSDLDAEIRELRLVAPLWDSFDQYSHPVDDDQNPLIGLFGEPADYFGSEIILARTIDLRWLGKVPNILNGMGILGTFLGLAAGIYLAKAGLSGGSNPEETREALARLLDGASLAFVTSIAGLGSSVVFSVFESRRFDSIRAPSLEIIRLLEDLVRVQETEQIPELQLKELREQTVQLKKFNTDLGVQISNALDAKLQSNLDPVVALLKENLGLAKSGRQEMDKEMLQGMVGEFHQALSGAAGSELTQTARSLELLQSGLSDILNGIGEQNAETIKAAETLARVVEGLDGQSQVVNHLRGASTSLEGITATLADVANRADRWIESTQALTNQMEDSEKAMEGQWEAFQRRFQGLDETLGRSFETYQNGLRSYSEEVQKYILEIESLLGRAIRDFGSGLAPLTAVSEEIPDRLQEFSKAIERLETALSGASNRTSSGPGVRS